MRASVVQLDTARTRYAIVVLPQTLSCKSYEILAVPLALNNVDAIVVQRVWALNRAQSNQRGFTIVARGYIFGISAFDLDLDDLVAYVSQVKVSA
jgi:hypothetical protein